MEEMVGRKKGKGIGGGGLVGEVNGKGRERWRLRRGGKRGRGGGKEEKEVEVRKEERERWRLR